MADDVKSEQKSDENQKHKVYGRKQNYNNYGYNNGRHKQEDLREKLNRMRQERDTKSSKPPPPDPPNSFLKDPLRDGEQTHGNTPKIKQQHKQSRQNTTKINLTQPINIKVEVSTTTGERSCVIDNIKKLPEIKHVPDKQNYYKKHYNKSNNGRYNQQQKRGEKQFYNNKRDEIKEHPKKDTKRDNNDEISNDKTKDTNETCDTQNT